ncbi:MAG: crosslink repair DNA glycosylase YcaQ family protein [Calditrichaceae bacterium]
MNTYKLTGRAARQIVLSSQGLDGKFENKSVKNGLINLFDQLGYIQIDTISVVERTHHHTPWVRLTGYTKELLHDLQAVDRLIFEYWGHAMSYIPMSDYRYFLPKMRRFENPSHPWVSRMYENGKHLLDVVMQRIREEGPLASKDFKRMDNKKAGTWWDWKPAKFALEYLFWRGDLMISERRKFQKVYDLTERVLPDHINLTMPGENEIARYLVNRALRAMGVANEREILKFLQPGSARDSNFQAAGKDSIYRAINELLEEKRITPVIIDGKKGASDYALTETLQSIDNSEKSEMPVHFLSPFDNLIIQRERIKRLFDFDYALECYLPAEKRKYGYFVLPVLFGDQFVGRLDPKADRKSKHMILSTIAFEEGFEPSEEFIVSFAKKIWEFADFNQCTSVKIETVKPAKLKAVLKSAINRRK